MKICLFTDTLGDLNGVSRFIQDMGEQAAYHQVELVIITSTNKPIPKKPYIINLPSRFKMAMPFYQELDLVLPKKGSIQAELERIQPDIVHISTPGPFGWQAKKVAEKLGYPLMGTYHTDFPAYLYDLTKLKLAKKITDKTMSRFYQSFQHVFSRSDAYLKIMAEDIQISDSSTLPAGTNLKRFHPKHHNPTIWEAFELDVKRLKVFYVGRINIEKNIPFVIKVWQKFQQDFPQIEADLILAGEGRYRKWHKKLRHHNIHFVGPVIGQALSQMYASSDLFIFPSITDTLGQVIMEAQASGTGCLVSDIGGPKTLVEHDQTGWVLQANNLSVWSHALGKALQDAEMRAQWGQNAHQKMQKLDIIDSYKCFIGAHQSLLEHSTTCLENPLATKTAN